MALPSELAALTALDRAKASPAAYYEQLLDSPDPMLRMGAWCALLDREDVPVERIGELVALAASPGIRTRAFRYLLKTFEYDLAEAVANVTPESDDAARMALMRAELDAAQEAYVAALRRTYLLTGDSALLFQMAAALEETGGWKAALGQALVTLLIHPHDPLVGYTFVNLLDQADDGRLLDAALAHLQACGLHGQTVMLFTASRRLRGGDTKGALKLLEQLAGMKIARPDFAARLGVKAREIAAQAFEKQGDYRKALVAFLEMKKLAPGGDHDPSAFYTMNRDAGRLDVPELPPDDRSKHYVMTGFPRSGTTLLENILSAHSDVETFEEIPSGSSVQFYLERHLPGLVAGRDTTPLYLEARRRYYREMDRRRRKDGPAVFIDKMPLRSAEAVFMKKLFPERRFIFSIRHPFDVVLSGLRQSFNNNVAMEHFRTFETAVKLYDFTMAQWFSVHDMQDPGVCYLRYDDLVTDFDASVARVLAFLGVAWDDRVREFAQLASQRSARTPSYGKVRQGLSIGVQTAWRNYDFLFQSPAAKPLYKWAEFFGYPTR